jgi:hypothetical protein
MIVHLRRALQNSPEHVRPQIDHAGQRRRRPERESPADRQRHVEQVRLAPAQPFRLAGIRRHQRQVLVRGVAERALQPCPAGAVHIIKCLFRPEGFRHADHQRRSRVERGHRPVEIKRVHVRRKAQRIGLVRQVLEGVGHQPGPEIRSPDADMQHGGKLAPPAVRTVAGADLPANSSAGFRPRRTVSASPVSGACARRAQCSAGRPSDGLTMAPRTRSSRRLPVRPPRHASAAPLGGLRRGNGAPG